MKKINFQEKFPVFTKNISKDSIKHKDIDSVMEFFKTKIQNHKVAAYISTFDNYEHTSSIGGEINKDIKNAQNIVFCFGKAIPGSPVLAVRPRGIGVCEYDDSFDICFLEAPNETIQETMEQWVDDLNK